MPKTGRAKGFPYWLYMKDVWQKGPKSRAFRKVWGRWTLFSVCMMCHDKVPCGTEVPPKLQEVCAWGSGSSIWSVHPVPVIVPSWHCDSCQSSRWKVFCDYKSYIFTKSGLAVHCDDNKPACLTEGSVGLRGRRSLQWQQQLQSVYAISASISDLAYGTWRYLEQMSWLPTCLEYNQMLSRNIHMVFFHRNFGWIRLQESDWIILRLGFLHKVQHTLVSCRCWERLLIDCQAAKNEQNREFFCAPFNLASVHVILPLKSGRSESVFRSVKMS